MIVWVNVVLNRTVVDSNSCFDNVCGSYLQSKKNNNKNFFDSQDDYYTVHRIVSYCQQQSYLPLLK